MAYQIAKKLETEIISADSRQIYIELGIGSNKPPAEYLESIPHHFINHVSVFEYYNAGRFGKECRHKLQQLFNLYDTLIMAGGSCLYIHSAIFELDDLPEPDMHIRRYLHTLLAISGLDYLKNWLREVDPEAYKIIELNNPVRIIRALEIYLTTGKTISSYWKKGRKNLLKSQARTNTIQLGNHTVRIYLFALWVDRHVLYQRINSRVDQMVFRGLVEEARFWYSFPGLYALRTHGYQEFFPYFAGRITLQEAIELVKRNTRNYAKRQISWWRRYPVCWVRSERAVRDILSIIR